MKHCPQSTDLRLAGLLGLAAGMRTTAPIVAMATDPGSSWYMLSGEAFCDKLPITPNRTAAGGIIGRMFSSVWGGLELARVRKASFTNSAVLAGVSAFVSTHLMYELRRFLVKRIHLPDALVASLEDACVVRLILYIRTVREASICR
jgi:hypothetical protein